jgi:hypothetical protein
VLFYRLPLPFIVSLSEEFITLEIICLAVL